MLESKAKEVLRIQGSRIVKYRMSLRRKIRVGQITPADSGEVAPNFRLSVLKTIEEEDIVQIYNADETAMNYEYLPTRTYDTKGTRTLPSRKLETEIYNRINRDGFGRGVWGEAAPLMDKHDVQIYCNNKGWSNANLSIKFLRFHFGSRASLGENILLLWDDFSGHWM
ncbi:CENPB protein Homeodomainlike [Phytophthora megakarya]|uniref:CENPB protein Homeodomainlike n=1 Tax=Phytophthora megakarya TaxID=4795 RepID=A0A225W2W3_9STRA|nr:CENPB protein Homeodomainlike [Phytophthora megakarya]